MGCYLWNFICYTLMVKSNTMTHFIGYNSESWSHSHSLILVGGITDRTGMNALSDYYCSPLDKLHRAPGSSLPYYKHNPSRTYRFIEQLAEGFACTFIFPSLSLWMLHFEIWFNWSCQISNYHGSSCWGKSSKKSISLYWRLQNYYSGHHFTAAYSSAFQLEPWSTATIN